MAEFLSKERVNVQSIGQFKADGLAKDFSNLFNAIGQTGKVIQESMIKESETAGKLLARDKKVELITKIEEEQRVRSEQGDDNYDFEASKQNMSEYMANTINDVREKFGEDSQAYKTFTDSFLLDGTRLSENFKTSMEKANETWAKGVLLNTTNSQLQKLVNNAGEKSISSFHESFKESRKTDPQISKWTTDTFVGKFANSAFDAKEVFNSDGTINKTKYKQAFNSFFDSLVTIDDDGKVTSKHSWLQQNDIDDMKIKFDTAVKGEIQKAEVNRAFKNTMLTIESTEAQTDFSSSEQVNQFIQLSSTAMDNALSSVVKTKESDITARNKKVNDLEILKKKFLIVENILSKDEDNIGVALSTGSYVNEKGYPQKVDKAILEKLAKQKLDTEFAGQLKEAKTYEDQASLFKALKMKETIYGTTSNVMDGYMNSIKNMTIGSTSADDIGSKIMAAKAMVASGYATLSDLGMTKQLLEKYEAIVTSAKMDDKKTFDNVKLEITQAELSHNTTSQVLDFRLANKNKSALAKLTADDDQLQSILTGFVQGVYVTNINANNHVGGFSSALNGIAMQMAEEGRELDDTRPLDEGSNAEILNNQLKKRLFISEYDAFNSQAMVLPDIVDSNGAKTPINGENFIKGIRQLAIEKFQEKGWKRPNINIEDNIEYKTEYQRGTGWTTTLKIRRNDTSPFISIGTYSGKDFWKASAKNKEVLSTKQSLIDNASYALE